MINILNKIKSFKLVLIPGLIMASIFLAPSVVSAQSSTTISNQLCNGITVTTGSQNSNCAQSSNGISNGIGTLAKQAVNILSLVVGVVSVIMIIYGGFKYITSGGESGKVTSAKTTLIYAILGLIVVALAQIIVQWVLGTSQSVVTAPAGVIQLLIR